jgi:cell division protein ZapE
VEKSPVSARAEATLAAHGQVLDEAQRAVLGRLEDLKRRMLARNSVLARGLRLLPRAPAPLRGLYLWGGVGRGKTFLVDEFFAELPVREKRREHFHRLMQDVHARLRRHQNLSDPLAQVAGDIAAKARILCVDEFVVGDVADAMILGTLLEALFRRGVTLVATSNLPPAELYRGGLQRARFLPAIALIEKHCRVLELDAGVDYRLRQLEGATLFLGPAVPDAESLLASEFARLAGGRGQKDARIQVTGRAVRARREAVDVVWFEFRELCEGPRSAADYIEIARCYQTVFLSGVPAMDGAADDAARRFVTLVDEFYDRGVKLVLSASADSPEALYRGERLAFEFRRTASRLQEMQGRKYLAKPHRP